MADDKAPSIETPSRHGTLVAAVSAAAAGATATQLTARSFFVAWNGVLVLTFDGFPPALAHIKERLASSAPELNLQAENFGSKWPKCTLAALTDAAEPLTLTQLTALKELCKQHDLAGCAPAAVSTISVVEYEQRRLEQPTQRTDIALQSSAGPSEPPVAEERERVDRVLSEWSDVDAYL